MGIVEWARRAEAAGFSSLGTIDRIVYPNYESLIALAAAAAVTERIRLVTDILIAPLRANTALLAKQAATIDNLSEGRLVLGLAVGGREDDYEVSGADFGSRGKTFDRQLEELGALWRGERGVGAAAGARASARRCSSAGRRTSPSAAPRATATVGRSGGGTPDAFAAGPREAARRVGGGGARRRAAHDGSLSTSPSATTPSRQRARASGTTTASSASTPTRSSRAQRRTRTPSRAISSAFEEAGADEVICFPTSTDPDAGRSARGGRALNVRRARTARDSLAAALEPGKRSTATWTLRA